MLIRSLIRSNFQRHGSIFPLTNSEIARKTLNAIMLFFFFFFFIKCLLVNKRTLRSTKLKRNICKTFYRLKHLKNFERILKKKKKKKKKNSVRYVIYFHCLLHHEEYKSRNVGVLNENIISRWCCINLPNLRKNSQKINLLRYRKCNSHVEYWYVTMYFIFFQPPYFHKMVCFLNSWKHIIKTFVR